MVAKRNRKDEIRIQREYLFQKFGRAIKATRYSRGRINSNWLVRKEMEEIVVRFYPTFFKEKLATEVWVLRELNGYGGKVPKLLDVDIDGFSTPVLFISKLSGDPLRDQETASRTMAIRGIIGELRELLEAVANIPTNVYGYLHNPVTASDIVDYTREMSSRYLNIIKAANLLPHKQIHALEGSLKLLQKWLSGKKARLTYPDLSPGNILLSEGRFSGLVDWEFLMGFEPHYGFANLILELSTDALCWARPTMILEPFTESQRAELVFLVIFRAVELLSYLPTTVIYTHLEKQTQGRKYTRALRELQKLIGY